MNKRGVSYITWGILLLAVSVGIAVQSTPNFDINSFKEGLAWDPITLEGESDLINALESILNGVGEGLFYIAKYVAQISSENPQVPFKLILVLVILAILAPILTFLIKTTVLLVILIKEWRANRRDKKNLRRLQREYEESKQERD